MSQCSFRYLHLSHIQKQSLSLWDVDNLEVVVLKKLENCAIAIPPTVSTLRIHSCETITITTLGLLFYLRHIEIWDSKYKGYLQLEKSSRLISVSLRNAIIETVVLPFSV